MEKELKQFEKYLLDPGTENAKDHLVFPLFQKLFPGKLKKQSANTRKFATPPTCWNSSRKSPPRPGKFREEIYRLLVEEFNYFE